MPATNRRDRTQAGGRSGRRRRGWRLAALFVVLCSSCAPEPAEGPVDGAAPPGSGAAPAAGEEPVPVVLIVVDTLRADRLGCYGNPRDTTPHLDALARDGLRFREARSQAPWTTASVGSLMTSQYPSSLGIENERSRVGDEWTLLAEVLKGAGHRTGAAISHIFCNAKWGFAQGFDEFEEGGIVPVDQSSSANVTAWGLDFLARQEDGAFFLWLHYFDPHSAYLEHAAHSFERTADYEGPVRPAMNHGDLRRMAPQLTEADRAELLRIYDSEVARTDAAIGEVLDDLRRRGLYDRALIVFTADHGEEFLEHGQIGHTKTLYDEVMHVPLIVKLPGGARAGEVVERPVGLVDVYPTVLDVLDLGVEHVLAGQSLLEDRERPVFFQTGRIAHLQGMLSGRYKIIWDEDRSRAQVYRWQEDGAELEDLSATLPEVRQGLEKVLRGWRRALPQAPVNQTDLTDEEIQALKANGYLDGGVPDDG